MSTALNVFIVSLKVGWEREEGSKGWTMAPWVNDLLYKHEKLTLDPHHPHETQAWWEAPVATALGQQSQVGLRGSPASLTTPVVSRWTEKLCLSKMRNSRGHHVALISVSLSL